MIEIPNEYGSLKIKELENFENENSIRLPEDYRNFLIKLNGGTPIKPYLTQVETDINTFFGIVDEPDWFSLFDAITDYEGRIPEYTMPIADDSFGNLFIIGFGEKNYGQVAFWDHEKESEEKDGGYDYFDNITILANSFVEFVKKLAPNPN